MSNVEDTWTEHEKAYGPDYAIMWHGMDGKEHLPFISMWNRENINSCVSGLNEHLIIKFRKISFGWRENVRDLALERRIYDRLGEHPRLIRYFGPAQNGLIFERLKTSVAICFHFMKEEGKKPSPGQSLRWSIQAAEALAHVHSKGVRQSDISCNNFLLDHDDNVKMCDFAGSQLDDGEVWNCPYDSATGPDPDYYWKAGDGQLPIVNELFALGSAIYEMWTTHVPYPELHCFERFHEYAPLYRAQKFPENTAALSPGKVILNCWHGRYESATEVAEALKALASDIDTTMIDTEITIPPNTQSGEGTTVVIGPDGVRKTIPPPPDADWHRKKLEVVRTEVADQELAKVMQPAGMNGVSPLFVTVLAAGISFLAYRAFHANR